MKPKAPTERGLYHRQKKKICVFKRERETCVVGVVGGGVANKYYRATDRQKRRRRTRGGLVLGPVGASFRELCF